MKVALYLRVSTSDQSVDSQLGELERYCEGKGWEVKVKIEDKISGASSSREGLDRLMKMVRKRSVRAVVVFKLDRLGRSLPHLMQVVMELDGNGVALVCPGQGIDTSSSNPAGRLQLHVLMAVAEFERSMISDRTKAGLAVAKAKGRVLGRPKKAVPENWREVVDREVTVRKSAVALGVSRGLAERLCRERRVEREAEG